MRCIHPELEQLIAARVKDANATGRTSQRDAGAVPCGGQSCKALVKVHRRKVALERAHGLCDREPDGRRVVARAQRLNEEHQRAACMAIGKLLPASFTEQRDVLMLRMSCLFIGAARLADRDRGHRCETGRDRDGERELAAMSCDQLCRAIEQRRLARGDGHAGEMALQISNESSGGWITMLGTLLQRLEDDAVQVAGQLAAQRCWRGDTWPCWRDLAHVPQGLEHTWSSLLWRLADEQVEQDCTER